MHSVDLLQRLWVATLALTAVIAVVAMLRALWRRVFGAEQACRLWWLPPLAVLVSQLPQPAVPMAVQLPAMPDVQTVIPQMAATTAHNSMDWQAVTLASWLSIGMVFVLLCAWRQWRFMRRLRDAQVLSAAAGTPRVLRLANALAGPALVGAWRPRIVVPADFERRYSVDERALILAHEQAHARRHDGLACALATLLQALFWFHPLVWWASRRFRRDQELACDAAVLRQHPHARRSYALAMLKTQTVTQALPAGCPWLGGHPVKERIAMLHLTSPQRIRRCAGHVAMTLLIASASVMVYAAQQPAQLYHPSKAMVAEALVLFNGMQGAVLDYAQHHGMQLPADSAAAQLPPASLINGKYVLQAGVRNGVITAALRDPGDHSTTAGHVLSVPHVNQAGKSIDWTCQSPDIPDIATLQTGCVYVPAGATATTAPAGNAGPVFQMAIGLEISGDSTKARHASRADMTLCTRSGQTASAKVGELSLDALLKAQADDIVSIAFTVAQKGVAQPSTMRIKGRLGQPMRISISGEGERSRSVTIDVTASKGCAAAHPAKSAVG